MKRFKFSTGSLITDHPAEIHSHQLQFKQFNLSNGLHCILYRDNRHPITHTTLGYKIGSKDESANKKGFAHLFEHMMFQGSQNIKKNEHFRYVMRSGGTCNAFTMQDATVYFDSMPSNNLETALWLESDRMNTLDISDENLTNQKHVVIEEKMQRYDNAPYGSLVHSIFSNVFKGSNYESSVIGEIEDINSFSVQEAADFHLNYYSPDNCVLMVSGDIDYDETEELIYKYFEPIKSTNLLNKKYNNISAINENIEFEVYDNIQLPMLTICFQIPKAGSDEDYIFEYFVEIMANNKSSRLYKKMIYEQKILKSIRAHKYMLEDAGLIFIKALINPGVEVNRVKMEIMNEINEFALGGCSDEEFQKTKNQLEFDNTIKHLRVQNISLESIFNYLYYKDLAKINFSINKYLSVGKQDLINSVNEFMIKKNKLFITYLPKKQ